MDRNDLNGWEKYVKGWVAEGATEGSNVNDVVYSQCTRWKYMLVLVYVLVYTNIQIHETRRMRRDADKGWGRWLVEVKNDADGE